MCVCIDTQEIHYIWCSAEPEKGAGSDNLRQYDIGLVISSRCTHHLVCKSDTDTYPKCFLTIGGFSSCLLAFLHLFMVNTITVSGFCSIERLTFTY